MAERGLKEEIEDMLSLVGGGWALRSVLKRPNAYMYEIAKPTEFFHVSAVSGRGRTRRAALRDLLANWRGGKTDMRLECPAGSTEELRLKLAIRGRAS
jgi:hypothetical protein